MIFMKAGILSKIRKITFFVLFLAIRFVTYGQGPGGVGSASNILFWYKGDAASGAVDGSPFTSWQDQSGRYANTSLTTSAIQFDGINDVLTGTSTYSGVTDNFTMECRVFPAGTIDVMLSPNKGNTNVSSTNSQRFIIPPMQGANTWGPGHAGAGISVGTNGVVVFEHSAGYFTPILVCTTALSTTAWSHIAVVYESNQPKLYINGVHAATGLTSDYIVHPSSNIGGANIDNKNFYYQGLADEIRFWNVARTLSQIAAFKDQQITGTAMYLVGNLRFDEFGSTQTFDATGNLAPLTLSNGPVWAAQDALLTYGRPIYSSTTNTINGKPVLTFDGVNSRLQIPTSTFINSAGPYASRTMNFVFKTSADVTARQVLFEEGDAQKGLNAYIDGGKIYAGAWNIPNNGPNSPWGPLFVNSSSIEINKSYILTISFDDARDVLEAYLNGTLINSVTGVGNLYSHSAPSIGYSENGTYFHTEPSNASGFVFNGSIAEIVSYNLENSAERKLIENHLSIKYNIPLTSNDYYAFEATHGFSVAGFGSDDASNTSLPVVASDFLTITMPSAVDDYFVMYGNDNQSYSAEDYLTGIKDAVVNAPKNVNRMLRTWRIDATQPTGILNFSIPQDRLITFAGYQKPVLILDNDGDFKEGSRVIVMEASGSNYVINNVSVQDNDFISFGILNQYSFNNTHDVTSSFDALGKANTNNDNVGYEKTSLTSLGLTVSSFSPLQTGNYLLLASNSTGVLFSNNSVPSGSGVKRLSGSWKVNEYGDVGRVKVSVNPATYDLGDRDTYVLLIDRDKDGVFTNAELVSFVKEGTELNAYVDLKDEEWITLGSAFADDNLVKAKNLNEPLIFSESEGAELTGLDSKQLVIKAQENFPYASPCVQSIKKSTLNLKLNTGKDHIFGNQDFSATVGVQVTGFDNYDGTGVPVVTYNAQLTIDKNFPEVLHFIDITKDYSTVKTYTVKISSFNPPSTAVIKNSIQLETSVDEEFNVNVPVTLYSPIVDPKFTLPSSGNVYKFEWETVQCEAPSYQFQLLRLFNNGSITLPGQTTTNPEYNISAEIDWSKALTLETNQKSISLTLTEGTGYYIWRVRAIGNAFSGGIADSRNWGTWSTDNLSLTSPIALTCTTSTCLEPYQNAIFYYKQFDRDKNFIYSRTFTEGNKIHESISYANGLLQVKQTQAVVPSNSSGQVLAGQTVYDYSGRPSLQSLSAPLNDGNIELGYRNNLFNSTGGLYGPKNFDTDTHLNTAPDPADPVNGGYINSYYSDDNSDPNVPSAENYPFSRTVFDNYGTGRVVETGGAGATHKIGGDHTVKIQYGSVSDDELIMIFGDEAPKAASVYKVATTDQNKITSIAYIDKSGKTIATCLSRNEYSGTSNLAALYPESDPDIVIKDKLDENVPYGDHGFKASKTLNFTQVTDLTVNYTITPAAVTSSCGTYCSTCGYLLKVKIIDLDNPANNKIIETSIPPETNSGGDCDEEEKTVDLDVNTANEEFTITLQPGNYVVERIIEIDQTAGKTYADNAVAQVNATLQPIVGEINNLLNGANISGLKAYLEGLIAAPGEGISVEVYSDKGAAIETSSLQEGNKIKIVTSCCSIQIPIIIGEYNPCRDYETYTKANMGDYFDIALFDKTGKHINEVSTYSPTEFTTLIKDMLEEPGGIYACDQLWNCWRNAVYSMGAMNTNTLGADIQNNPNAGQLPSWGAGAAPANANFDLVNQFLDCAGRKYAGFVPKSTCNPSTNHDLVKLKPYKYFYYCHESKTLGQRLCENTFCNYATPTEGTSINTAIAYSPCNEGEMCPKSYFTAEDNTYTSKSYTMLTVGQVPNPVHVLTSDDYSSLAQCLANQKVDEIPEEDRPVVDEAYMQAQKIKMESQCTSACDSKYPNILEQLVRMNSNPYPGPELQTNNNFTQPTGGWVQTNGNPPFFLYGVMGRLDLISQYEGKIVSTASLTSGKNYSLRFYLHVPSGCSLNVYSGTNLIATYEGYIEKEVALDFTAAGNTITFQGVVPGYASVTINKVFLKQNMPPLEYPMEDLCCTARQLVDYCKQNCNLTIVKADCAPVEDKFVSLGTNEELKYFNAILYGTFDIQVPPSSGVCYSDYNKNTLILSSLYTFTGNANDGSGNGVDATVNGCTLTTDRNNIINQAYLFNGTSNNINAGAGNRSVTNRVTVSAWIKTTSTATQAVISKMNTSSNKGYQLMISGGAAYFQGRDGAALRTSGNSTLVNDGTWHFLTGVCNNGIWQIYVDGVKKNENNTAYLSTDLSNTGDLTIGYNKDNNSNYFSGSIDEVAVYAGALTETQIQNLFSNPLLPYTLTPANCGNIQSHTYEKWQLGLSGVLGSDGSYNGYQVSNNGIQVNELKETSDGGYMYLSGIPNFTGAGIGVRIVKLNSNGSVSWTRDHVLPYFTSSHLAWIKTFNVTSDGGYLLAGVQSIDHTMDADYWVIKYDAAGNLQFNNHYGGTYFDILNDCNQTSDGGFILSGVTNSGVGRDKSSPLQGEIIEGNYDYWIVKIDASGNFQWDMDFGGTGYDRGVTAIQTTDGGYLIAGDSESDISGNKTVGTDTYLSGNFWLIKLDAARNVQWQKNYGGLGQDDLVKVIKAHEGGYMLAGVGRSGGGGSTSTFTDTSPTGSSDFWVVKIDANGNYLWDKVYGGISGENLTSMIRTYDGGYIVSGYSWSNASLSKQAPHYGEADYYVVKIDNLGNIQWDQSYGGTSYDELGNVLETKEHDYIIFGSSYSLPLSGNRTVAKGNQGKDAWIIKFGLKTNQPCNPRQVCIKWIAPNEIIPGIVDKRPEEKNYDEQTAKQIKEMIESQLATCKANNESKLIEEYNTTCGASKIKDNLELSYKLMYEHYTLYYYDRAQNLVKTVPPKGVVPLVLTATGVREREVHPSHTLATTYKYNSLNQLIEQNTPDGGTTKFIYNSIGLLRFSQSAKQALTNEYSYTRYDALGRVIEVGKAPVISSNFESLAFVAEGFSYPETGGSEQTFTVYSQPATNVNYLGNGQRYLDNRVSYTYSISTRGEKSATYYSYDPHGNVEWIVQELPGFTQNHIAYEYDLISNKVTKVKYNLGKNDQFFHKYDYDADNRITAVYTSKDGLLWDKDAAYQYYKHGPLKRTELGEDHIQGLDYAYTIHGWLKGINTPAYDKAKDPGLDGIASNNKFLKDEYGMILGYYNGDFTRTGSPYTYSSTNNFQLQTTKSLYNGNISSWTSRVEQEYADYLNENGSVIPPANSNNYTTGNNFTYDQLNRLTRSEFRRYNGSGFTPSNEFSTYYTYDPNGNIIHLGRNGKSSLLQMDDLSYYYRPNTNQLDYVDDAPSNYSGNYPDDIDAQSAGNYSYDAIGNLVGDVSESIEIEWNTYGKIDAIVPVSPSPKPYIAFTYDAMGNRVKKEVNSSPYPYTGGQPTRLPQHITTTYYVRDASGNIMAVYERKNEAIAGQPGFYTATFTLMEVTLYGSSRLGNYAPDNTIVATKVFATEDMDKITFENQVLSKVTENTVWATSGLKTDVVNNKNSVTTNINTVSLQQLSYNTSGDNYAVAPQASFIGSMKKNIAVAESRSGQLQFTAVTASSYWGKQNVCLVYDASGNLMPNSGGINADPSGKAIILRKPGTTEQYYLFTTGTDGRLYYTLVDMSLPGNGTTGTPMGDVVETSKNLIIDLDNNTNYGNILLGLENDAKKESVLYATRFTPDPYGEPLGNLDLVVFTITDNGNVAQKANTIATVQSQNSTGFSEMQISPDTRKMLLYNHKLKIGWFDYQESEIIVFNMGVDYKAVENPVVSTDSPIPVPGTYGGMSADFTSDSRYIYYTRDLLVKLGTTAATSKTTSRYDLRNGNLILVNNSYMGDVRRGKDGRIHIDNVNGTSLPAYVQNDQSVLSEVTGKAINVSLGGGLLSGALPTQVHRIYFDQLQGGEYKRNVNLKQYEISDHLGNVTVVVSDQRAVTIVGSTVTGTANVLAYNNYYPFGMQMPERFKTPQLYRYGFNGKEKDSEWNSGGAIYDYGFRIYDPRIGKFLSVDPLFKSFPWNSSYAFAENDVISCIDLEGLEKYRVTIRTFLPFSYVNEPINGAIDKANVRTYVQYANVTAHGGYKSEQIFNINFYNPGKSQYTSGTVPPTYEKENGKVFKYENGGLGDDGTQVVMDEDMAGKKFADIHARVSTNNPAFFGAPAIDYNLYIELDIEGNYRLKGMWDGFPAIEIFLENEETGNVDLLYSKIPSDAGTTADPAEITKLFPIYGDIWLNQKGKAGDKPYQDSHEPSDEVQKTNELFKHD